MSAIRLKEGACLLWFVPVLILIFLPDRLNPVLTTTPGVGLKSLTAAAVLIFAAVAGSSAGTVTPRASCSSACAPVIA